jgi:RNA polymerase sigma factor (sigma-70 family)
MLTPIRRAVRPREAASPAPDDLFLERYQSLLARALHLTGGNREDASDLVQDAYVHFVLGRTPLESIRDVDAYLYTMLRHLHVSQIRRRVRHPQTGLDPLDFDVAAFALRATEAGLRQQVLQELRAVLDYACSRREASKAASVLLLRYFHGYYVREIAQVLKTPARVVDNLLHVGRREARAFSADPLRAVPHPFHGGASRPTWSRAGSLDDLRAAIFGLAHGCCYPLAWFDACYRRDSAVPLDGKSLAALVTCARCLDQANAVLGLPLLAERYPTDMLGPDRRTPPEGGSAGGGMDATNIARLRRRVTDVTEHKPRELFVSVNGFVVGSQTVHGKCTEQTVSLTIPETPGFVEVFSEQQVQLLFLMVEPPPAGAVEQALHVVLSQGRSLEVGLSFSDAWPALRVAYRDPQWGDAGLPPETPPVAEESEEASGRKPHYVEVGWWRRLRRSGWPYWAGLLRPGSLPATALLLLLAWIGIQYLRGTPDLSARELLRQVAAAEDAVHLPQDVVRHRVFDLEERRADDGALLSRTKVEFWQGSGGRSAIRRYDAAGVLLSLNLTATARQTVLYRPGAAPIVASGTELDEARRAIESGDVSRLAPSARAFEAIVGGLPEGSVERTGSACTIEYRARRGPADYGLIRASLQLTRDGLRPTAQVFVIALPSGPREYRFIERLMEALPERGAAGRAAFERDRFFEATPSTPPAASGRPSASVLSVDEQAALTVEALFLLDQAGATLGDEIELRTDPSGMSVRVLVGDAARKRRVLEALGPIALEPAVRLDVRTVHEASRQHRNETPRIARDVGPAEHTIRAHADLHRYLSGRLGGQADDASRDRVLQQQVTEFAARALGGARQALLHAWALEHLVEQVPVDRVERLDASARAKWRSMVREHSVAFLRVTERLRLEVEPVFLSALVEPGQASDPPVTEDDVASTIHRLLALAIAQDEAVRSAFTLPTLGADPTFVVKTPQFWRQVRRAETIAKRLAEID